MGIAAPTMLWYVALDVLGAQSHAAKPGRSLSFLSHPGVVTKRVIAAATATVSAVSKVSTLTTVKMRLATMQCSMVSGLRSIALIASTLTAAGRYSRAQGIVPPGAGPVLRSFGGTAIAAPLDGVGALY